MFRSEPVVSFVITSFNQKDYILKAVKAAMDQDYVHLEIIVADDHSTDGSYEELLKFVGEYEANGGVHKIILRRNETNLGVLRNCEGAFTQAKGELIVLGGGDDVSHSNRVSTIVKHWLDAERKPTVIFHGVNLVGLDGQPLGKEFWHPTIRNPLGAAMAFSPVVVRNFPDSVETRGYEDNVFARRAYAFGDPLYIDEKLVDYRQGCGSTTVGTALDCRKRISRAMMFAAKQNLIDIEHITAIVDRERIDELRNMLGDCLNQYESEFQMLTGNNVIRRYLAYRRYIRHPMCLVKPNLHNFLTYYFPVLLPICAVPIERGRAMYRWFKGLFVA